ncbi:MAG: polysulfide reductase NrfD, partial [Verrucomicrobia bacterium]|nr:polysulfide reductase NrfD [Verrucomicrobiota bacterium]
MAEPVAATATATSTVPFEERMPRPPLVENHRSMAWISDLICGIVESKTPKWWYITTAITGSFAAFGVFCIFYLLFTGVGVWGNNIPVGWAWDITNFVFWIGIGHAGTLISAILFLTRQKWRTSINRASEAMTLFAVICAGIFPGIHVGRIWMVWFIAPVPVPNWIWPNFRSPLVWDVFAVSTYFTVSVLFWYLGLVPDLATMRDRARSKAGRFIYGVLAFGWRGGNRQWRHYEMAYLVLAGLSTPLVLSVHSTVSFDFATSVLPGWHTTIFPPYFVAGAIFGGFAMVLTLMMPARAIYRLHDVFTWNHIDVMCKIILLTGSIVGYAYVMEWFVA